MKKILFCLLIVILTVMSIGMVVYAADSAGISTDVPTDYLSWEFLGTMAGIVTVTTLLTQFLKLPLDKVWKIPTRYIVFVIALILLFAVEYVKGSLTIDRSIMILLNAVVVTMASLGTYETTIRKLELKNSD